MNNKQYIIKYLMLFCISMQPPILFSEEEQIFINNVAEHSFSDWSDSDLKTLSKKIRMRYVRLFPLGTPKAEVLAVVSKGAPQKLVEQWDSDSGRIRVPIYEIRILSGLIQKGIDLQFVFDRNDRLSDIQTKVWTDAL